MKERKKKRQEKAYLMFRFEGVHRKNVRRSWDNIAALKGRYEPPPPYTQFDVLLRKPEFIRFAERNPWMPFSLTVKLIWLSADDFLFRSQDV